MVGIVTYGAYIPKWRIGRDLLRKGMKGEKAVAGPDEDSVTMAVAAALDCLNGVERVSVDGLFFASTTAPYKEKQIATIIAAAADLRRDILTADFANSLRAGTNALRAAADAVKAGSAKKVMVVASDSRLGGPSSELELEVGDGAAAVLIGQDNVAVEIEDSYSVANELIDVWRADDDKFIRAWEDRFAQTVGLLKVVPEAVGGLLKKAGHSPGDFSKLVTYAPNSRRAAELGRKLSFDPKSQIQDSIFDTVGNTGTAYPFMLLVSALEEASAGDRILLASYGNGSDAFSLQATEALGKIKGNRRGVSAHIESKRPVPDYITYLKWREILDTNPQHARPTPIASATNLWREHKGIIPFHGQKCKECGQVEWPPQRICSKCQTKDQFEEVRLSEKRAKLFTHSKDVITSQVDLPLIYSVVNFEGGGRMITTVTDKEVQEIHNGMDLEPTFRKLFHSEGHTNYFWKTMPIRLK